MILHGIEYQRPTSLNMRILADHVTYSFLAFMKSIFHFCFGCYCRGYSQNRRSNLSSLHRKSQTWAACICQRTGPPLVQIMACHLFGVKFPSHELGLTCQLGPQEIFEWNLYIQVQFKEVIIGIDTNIEVIVVSLTTWEAHHSPRAKPEGCGGLPRSLMRQQWPKLRYQFLFYHDETKLTLNQQILSI